MYRTKRYKAWIKEAGQAVQMQGVPRKGISSPVRVEAFAGAPDKRSRDLDNLTKSIGDFLEDMNFVTNDSLIHGWTLGWSPDVTNGVFVTIIPMPGEAA